MSQVEDLNAIFSRGEDSPKEKVGNSQTEVLNSLFTESDTEPADQPLGEDGFGLVVKGVADVVTGLTEDFKAKTKKAEALSELVSKEQSVQYDKRYPLEMGSPGWMKQNAERYQKRGILEGFGEEVGGGLRTQQVGAVALDFAGVISPLPGGLVAPGASVLEMQIVKDEINKFDDIVEGVPFNAFDTGQETRSANNAEYAKLLGEVAEYNARTTFGERISSRWNYGYYGNRVSANGEEMFEAGYKIIQAEKLFADKDYLEQYRLANSEMTDEEIWEATGGDSLGWGFRVKLGVPAYKGKGVAAWKKAFLKGHWERVAEVKSNFDDGIEAQFNVMQYAVKLQAIERHPGAVALQNAKTWFEVERSWATDRIGVTADIGMTSAYPSMLVLGGAAVSGKLTNPAGFLMWVGGATFELESTAELFGTLSEKVAANGGDLADFDSILTSMGSPEFYEESKADANLGGLIVAAGDMLAASMALRVLAPIQITNTLARETVNMFAQMGTQMFLGAGSEALKQYIIDGEIAVGEVAAEGIGELLTAPVDVGVVAVAGLREFQTERDDILNYKDPEGLVGPLEPYERRALRQLKRKLADLRQKIADTPVDQVIEGDAPQGGIDAGTLEDVNTGLGMSVGTAAELGRRVEVASASGFVALETVLEGAKGEVFVSQEVQYEEAIISAIKEQSKYKVGTKKYKEAVHSEILHTNLQNQIVELQELMTGTLQEWGAAILPDHNFITSFGQVGVVMSPVSALFTRPTTTIGSHVRVTENTSMIQMNLKAMADKNGMVDKKVFMDSVMHEFGHGVISTEFEKLPLNIQYGLRNTWIKWLNDLTTLDKKGKPKTLRQFFQRTNGYYTARFFEKGISEELLKTPLKGGKNAVVGFPANYPVDYILGFNEWLADSMSRSSSDKGLLGFAREDLKGMRGTLQRYWRRFGKDFSGQEVYNNFVRSLALNTAITNLDRLMNEDRKAANPPSVAIDEIVASVSDMMDKTGVFSKKGDYTGKDFKNDMVKFKWRYEHGYTLLQIAEKNPNISGVQRFVAAVQKWWKIKSIWTNRAEETLKAWQKLSRDSLFGERRSARVGEFLLGLTAASSRDETLYSENSKVFQELVLLHKVDEEMLEVIRTVQVDMLAVNQAIQDAAEKNLRFIFKDDPKKAADAIREMKKNIASMNNRNFFPMSRFGKFYVNATARKAQVIDGKEYKVGDQLWYTTVDTKKEQKALQKEARKDGHVVRMGVVDSTTKDYGGLPPQFITFLQSQLKLTEDQIVGLPEEQQKFAREQQETLGELMKNIAPGQSFIKHRKKRRNVKGYSLDGMRSYANYFMHFANYIAKLEQKAELFEAVDEVRKLEYEASLTKEGSNELGGILKSLAETRDYLLSPEDEWAGLRAAGFVMFLGFNVKSAVVNLTQVPMVLYPYLGARYSDIGALKAIGKAYGTATNYWKNPEKVSKAHIDLVNYLKDTGIIDESAATEIAGVAQGSLLARLAPAPLKSERVQRGVRSFMSNSAAMFQWAEKSNRYVTAFAAYDLAVKAGDDVREATKKAFNAIATTQGEYARWNRPKFMRGKKSGFFMFWMYRQMMIHFTFNDPGNKRHMLMLFAFAGVMGLPFAEDVGDGIEWLVRMFGDKTFNIRRDMRELVNELGLNPDLIMHGIGGPGVSIGDLTGLPIPNVDWSGSIGMGRLVPMARLLGTGGDFDRKLRVGAEEFLGPLFGYPLRLMQAYTDKNPDEWKRWEKVLPSFIQSASKAGRMVRDEGVTTIKGARLTEIDTENPRDILSVGLQGFGFRPGESAKAQAKYYMTQEIVRYYTDMKASITRELVYAVRIEDDDLLARVQKEILKYNDSLPVELKGLGFTSVLELISVLMKDAEERALVEAGVFSKRPGVQQYIDLAYPDEVKGIGGGVVEEKDDSGEQADALKGIFE